MKVVTPRSWRLVHFCGWDRMCRSTYSPWFLYFHFLCGRDGHAVRVDLSPPWVRRSNRRWLESVQWQRTGPPRRGDR